MNNRSKNNSIIFLTTLSVYLGLVLVGGGTPSVLAQAATTRQFDIKNEIEFNDDLDKKPNDENCADLSSIADKRLTEFGFEKYAILNLANFIRESVAVYALKDSEIRVSYENDGSYDFLLPIIQERFPANLLTIKTNSTKKEVNFSFNYSVNSPSDAYLLAYAFDASLFYSRCQTKKDFYSKVYQNTVISYENNQVFIVTRLPRGSLDALLKQDAKAENQ